MTTLKQLFQTFCHDPKWGRLAIQSAQPMVSVFMRKLGDTDITTLRVNAEAAHSVGV